MADYSHREIIHNRKNRERLSREQVIIEAAKKLFFSRGYLKTTMDDIALEAEISKPTVYQHFKNKDDLFFSLTLPLLKRFVDDMEAMLKKLEAGAYKSGAEIIDDHFRTHIEIFTEDPEAFRVFMLFQQTGVFFEVNRKTSGKISALAKERYNGMRRLYSRAIELSLIKKVDVYHLVEMIWGSFLGIIMSLEAKNISRSIHKDFTPVLDFTRQIITESIAI